MTDPIIDRLKMLSLYGQWFEPNNESRFDWLLMLQSCVIKCRVTRFSQEYPWNVKKLESYFIISVFFFCIRRLESLKTKELQKYINWLLPSLDILFSGNKRLGFIFQESHSQAQTKNKNTFWSLVFIHEILNCSVSIDKHVNKLAGENLQTMTSWGGVSMKNKWNNHRSNIYEGFLKRLLSISLPKMWTVEQT